MDRDLDIDPAPADGPSRRRPASWHARSGRITARKRWALEELAPPAASLDPAALRAADAVVVELGAGTGEAALELAAARPEVRVVATEVHKASVATLLLRAHEQALPNLTVVIGDGRDTLAALGRLRPVDVVRIFFPDPWPKHRHRARRLVGPDLLGLLAAVLAPHGRVELATDDPGYAAAARRAVAADPRFRVLGTARASRPVTYYERQALDAGRVVHDLQFGPADAPAPTEDR